MEIQGQGMFRQDPSGGPTQQRRPISPGPYLNYYNTIVFNNNPSQHTEYRRNNEQPYPPSYKGQQKYKKPYANQRQMLLAPQSQPQVIRKLHMRLHRH